MASKNHHLLGPSTPLIIKKKKGKSGNFFNNKSANFKTLLEPGKWEVILTSCQLNNKESIFDE